MNNHRLPRLLVVDDEPLIIRSLNRSLRNRIEVIGATCCQDAINRLAFEKFDAILAEASVLDSQGRSFVQRLEQERPELIPRLILSSGGKSMEIINEARKRHGCPFLPKPVPTYSIIVLVSQMKMKPPQ